MSVIQLQSASTRRQILSGAAGAFGALIAGSAKVWASPQDGVSHAAESIHQEPVFKADRKRVYEALTDGKQFQRLVDLSGALKSGELGSKPVEIGPEVGGAFTLFGGHIIGRQLELVANQRIVQAWRVVDWNPGVYSIVKFELTADPSGTKIIFDHTGFPQGLGEHLADGWKAYYWEPLQKYLSQA